MDKQSVVLNPIALNITQTLWSFGHSDATDIPHSLSKLETDIRFLKTNSLFDV